jgi:hypothetical protein
MATSAAQIYADIKQELLDAGFVLVTPPTGGSMDAFIMAIATAVYKNMQLLQDTAGNPPSPGHT